MKTERPSVLKPGRPRVQSVARAVNILLAVAESPRGLSVREISESLGINRQTTYHLVRTLASQRMLINDDSRRYVLGIRVATLAEGFKRHVAPPEYLIPYLREIASATGETAYATGWWQGEIVIFGVVRGKFAIQANDMSEGLTSAAHARASGKVLLAFAPKPIRDDYLRLNPPTRRTPRTLTGLDALEAEFATIRAKGFATDREEFADGVCCIAVPLDFGASPFVFALSAPADRFEASWRGYLELIRTQVEHASGRVADASV